jgi:hypothetical protein
MEMWKIAEEHALEMLPVLGLELPGANCHKMNTNLWVFKSQQQIYCLMILHSQLMANIKKAKPMLPASLPNDTEKT